MQLRVKEVDWHYAEWGDADGQPLLLLHGFTGSSQSWSSFAKLLGSQYRIIAPDLPGHGKTSLPAQRLSLWEFAAALGEYIARFSESPVSILGYSMGGRIALHLALKHSSLINKLILLGASPGIADATERSTRKAQDAALAEAIRERGIEWFVDFWEQQPIFKSQQSLPTELRKRLRDQRLQNSPEGLVYALECWSSGEQENLMPRLSELTLPVLLMAGELDSKYAATNQQMQKSIAEAKRVTIPAAGHAAYLEQPERIAAEIKTFLS